MAKKAETVSSEVIIKAPALRTAEFTVRGTSPYVQLRFSEKQKKKIHEDHGQDEKNVKVKKTRAAKDYDALYEEAMFQSGDGHRGLNAMSFKKAMVAACRLTSMQMKLAKISFFVEPDGFDAFEEIPMVYFTKGEPHYCEHICRNANMMPDLRVRAMWDTGWEAKVRVKYDADILSLDSLKYLLTRAGVQVGIGEGRADSTKSDGAGMGWGSFEVVKVTEVENDDTHSV